MPEFQSLDETIVHHQVLLGRAISIIWLLHPFCNRGRRKSQRQHLRGEILQAETNTTATCTITAVPRSRRKCWFTRVRLSTWTPIMKEIRNTSLRRITQINCKLSSKTCRAFYEFTIRHENGTRSRSGLP